MWTMINGKPAKSNCSLLGVAAMPVLSVANAKWLLSAKYRLTVAQNMKSSVLLGSNCGVNDLQAIAKTNELCSAYMLDSISTGATIAFAMECF
jgi:aldehyde:ferredoxin oxidoreductase